jgi:hypothetical protein
MAIQPIDLQALFTQVEKVGKAQSAQREGLALQQEIQGVQLQRKTEEDIKSVNSAQNTGEDGTEKVKEREAKGHDEEGEKKKDARHHSAENENNQAGVFSDPRLGNNIDISY